MKAIITNLSKESSYYDLIGQTFEVKEVLHGLVALKINGKTTDFSFKEIFIVDIEKEVQTAYDNWNWDSGKSAYTRIMDYCNSKNINVSPNYNSFA
jgi:hypothetical protein